MHALNNYKGGPYIQKEDCRRAAVHVCNRLSEALGGDVEDHTEHLDQESGWLSIDVINVLGAANLGIHVDPAPFPIRDLEQAGPASFLVNCNKMRWTVSKQCAPEGPWEHTNSIVVGDQMHHGERTLSSQVDLFMLFASIKKQYGSFSLHRINTTDADAGASFLEREGMRAMLPQEVPEALEDQGNISPSIQEQVCIVTVNVDGLGEYQRSPTQRLAAILDSVLRVAPDVLHLQEVTAEMYEAAKVILHDWQLLRLRDNADDYFPVTALRGCAATFSVLKFGVHTDEGRHADLICAYQSNHID